METKQEFDEIILLPEERKSLVQFSKKSPMKECPCYALSQNGLVTADCSGTDSEGSSIFTGTYSITSKGVRYLAYQKRARSQNIGKYFAGKWIDFLALIVAIIALIRTF